MTVKCEKCGADVVLADDVKTGKCEKCGAEVTVQENKAENAEEAKAEEAKAEEKKPMTAQEKAKKVGGHGGMDFVMDYRLIYCLRHGLPLDMDVYDLAEWCSVIELSKISLENGNRPVEVPDFTRGAWNKVQGYRHAYAE